ncbi:unnamed protein product, partial [marine sediment metagenome]
RGSESLKLVVQGIEEIEITDPAGLCNPPAPPRLEPPSGVQRKPQLPTPLGIPHKPIYPAGDPLPHHTRWGIGSPMIKQAGDPDKWQKSWQASMGEKGVGDGDGNAR